VEGRVVESAARGADALENQLRRSDVEDFFTKSVSLTANVKRGSIVIMYGYRLESDMVSEMELVRTKAKFNVFNPK